MRTQPRHGSFKDSGIEWIGQVPGHWEIRRNLGLFEERKEVNRPDLDLLSVTIERGVVRQDEITAKKDSSNEDKSKYKVVRKGDLAYNKMRMWQGAIGVSDYDGIVSPAYIILNTRDKLYARYFHYLYRTEMFIAEANRHSYGLCSDMNSLRYEDFKTIYSPFPPRDDVERILIFLDPKTAEIDEAIAKKQRLIELLKEKKGILINQAVTKGLNPNVPMHDSGVEWIGEIPASWTTCKLKHSVKFVSGGTPSKENKSFWGDEVPWVSPKDMKVKYISDSIDKITHRAVKMTNLKLLQPGCVLIVVRGMILAKKIPVALTMVPATINQDMKAILPSEGLNPTYLMFLLDSLHDQLSTVLEESGHGTKTLPTDQLGLFTLPVPSLGEQKAIVSHVRKLDTAFNETTSIIEGQIEQLAAFRNTLIAEAVTGKIRI